MADLVRIQYQNTGKSSTSNALGMREMQAKAYKERNAQYILLKAPPASGKSRALMFLGLDKLYKQGVKKVIVAVPERSIGSSFATTDLTNYGFFRDWEPNDKYNLCTPDADGSKRKVVAFQDFMKSDEKILICTHATLRFAFDQLEVKDFDNTLVSIDEFHHVSADEDNRLGEVLKRIMTESSAHIVAMTGSYFRGDSVPVLPAEEEAKFTRVTYDYYEQLNGYKYLKSLGIGYHFYQGQYMSAIGEVLDTSKKTIIHIPSVNSAESTKDKHGEVAEILGTIGEFIGQDKKTGIIKVRRKGDKKILKVANLVYDDQKERDKVVAYLRSIESVDDMDIIIALGMAKEGFDWPYCEHALTVGYRGSLTEIIQIIGRATRDSSNKTHAQFTNLLAAPNAEDNDVKYAVNNMLKAITASLLMEQVMAPVFKFKRKKEEGEEQEGEEGTDDSNTISVINLDEPSTKKVKEILESDLNDLKATILQDTKIQQTMNGNVDPAFVNKVLIPKIIEEKYPDLTEEETEQVRQNLIVDTVVKNTEIKEKDGKKFIKLADKFINIEDLHIDMIDQVNPFQKAYEVLSKSVTKEVLKVFQDTINNTKITITEEEAAIAWPKIEQFVKTYKREPSITSHDLVEKRLAECLVFVRNFKRNNM